MGKVSEMEQMRQDIMLDKYFDIGHHPMEAVSKSKQIGGNHYDMPIQPIDYIVKNNLGYIEGNIIKYISRYKNKNGIEDLMKAKHYIEMLIEENK